jgi:hypothetical protein
LICSFNFLIFLAVCLNISTVINIKVLTNSNQQTHSYRFTSHIAAFLSVFLITKMLKICIQTSYDQNVQLILKSYLPVVLSTTLWSPAPELSTLGCSSTHNKALQVLQRTALDPAPTEKLFMPLLLVVLLVITHYIWHSLKTPICRLHPGSRES